MMPTFSSSWAKALDEETSKPYFIELMQKVDAEYASHEVFPPKDLIFHAFDATPLMDVKVVIFGQDPYHDVGQAHGLCFSVQPGVKPPRSLRNMYKELADDVGFEIPDHGCLESWASQGVLLLNTVLTVRAHEPGSHQGIGWETFTDAVTDVLNAQNQPIVFLLWGNAARAKKKRLDNPNHLVLEAAHPSPLSASRGFFGCHHFSKTNEFLIQNGCTPIDWQF